MRNARIANIALAAIVAVSLAVETMAKPPPWAPAHGYRAKHDPFYVGYAGHQWSRDYGILGGRCNTDEVLAVVGAVAGGAIAGSVAKPQDRAIATVLGAIIGGVLGAQIGDHLDERDRACIGHSLELARTGQSIRWTNPATGYGYQVKPVADLADGCREFELVRTTGGRSKPARMRACTRGPGDWTLG
jgi:surface antigen